ncbi:hypothetical protein [Burkholderia ambifaria]|uniref:hypothetical protein n=1 Tax=Burkholderia ambifaria TaxID=152480 RepID=UPI0015932A56|nr:hypothetical protein [Burkholderia ambifaria]
MADSYTPNLNLVKPEVGGDPDTWGTLLNSNMDKIDANAALNMPKSGGTFTGPVTISGSSQGPFTISSTGQYCGIVISGTGNGTQYSPRIQTNADPNVKSIGVVNGANTTYNLIVYDDGRVTIPNNNLTVGSTVYQNDGNLSGPVWGGPLSTWLANNKVQKTGDTISGRINFAKQGWQADFQMQNLNGTGNANVYLRARQGGGLEIINSAYNAVPWQSDDGGQTWQSGNLNVGGAVVGTNGDLFMPIRGQWLSDALNSKAGAGNQCVYASGQIEWDYVGSVNSNIHGQIDMGSPWVSNGLRVNASTSSITAIWQRSIWLRNQ